MSLVCKIGRIDEMVPLVAYQQATSVLSCDGYMVGCQTRTALTLDFCMRVRCYAILSRDANARSCWVRYQQKWIILIMAGELQGAHGTVHRPITSTSKIH
jgi:hypothetical protein